MDKIEALGNSIAQISLYDIKSYYNQAKAVVMNYTEMETKVREATNDDPWGASSTLMQEIAHGTFNFQQFNEIMPTIYKRFTEKEACEWRQIYKALQLLEYLIKNGSERVIDDARSHVSMIKILRNFHYIDDKGKDQGINVRNRAKEIAELLSDLDRVRQERRKAKATRNKYVGVGNEGPSFSRSGGSKYGGFGSDSLGFSGGTAGGDDWSMGAGGSSSRDGYGGSGSSAFKQGDDFEEYDAGEWEDRPSTSTARRTSHTSAQAGLSAARKGSISVCMKKAEPKATLLPKAAKEVDLFSMGDDEEPPVLAPSVTSNTAAAPLAGNAAVALDDDFDDFQSAPPSAAIATSAPQPATGKPNVFALLNANPPAAAASSSGLQSLMSSMSSPITSQAPLASSASNMNTFNPLMIQPMMASNVVNVNPGPLPGTQKARSAQLTAATSNSQSTMTSKAADDFGDLFSFAGMSNTTASSSTKPQQPKISMAAMAREQSSASIWGPAQSANSKPTNSISGIKTGTTPSSVGGAAANDDLLL